MGVSEAFLTPKVLLRVAQGCNAKRATLGPDRKMPYPNGVIADRQRVGNNAFSVEKTGDSNSNPRVARFALQPWATRNYFGVGEGLRLGEEVSFRYDPVVCSRRRR